jgi:isoleucyl-tRNA synthetase
MLGIKGPDDVMKMGVKAYNDECRKIVSRYSSDWKVKVDYMYTRASFAAF